MIVRISTEGQYELGDDDVAGLNELDNAAVSCCGSDWSGGYANLVARLTSTYLRGNAGRVYWFLLPVPQPGNFQSLFNGVNAGIKQAAARFPARVGLIDAASFFTPAATSCQNSLMSVLVT